MLVLRDDEGNMSSENNVEQQDPLNVSVGNLISFDDESNESQSGQAFEQVDSVSSLPTATMVVDSNVNVLESIFTAPTITTAVESSTSEQNECAPSTSAAGSNPNANESTTLSQRLPITSEVLSNALNSTTIMKFEPIFEQMAENDARAVENVLNSSYDNIGEDDDVMIHRNDRCPKPKADLPNPYQIKSSDPLSANMTFALGVSHIQKTNLKKSFIIV